MRHALTLLPLAVLAACSSAKETSLGRETGAPPSQVATTQLLGPNGELRGTATLEPRASGVHVMARVEGFGPGSYAIHVHTAGRCDAPTFESAGGHLNPASKQHGKDNPMGPHAGDLPNIEVAAAGRGETMATIPGLTMAGVLDADGAAVIVHAGPDDYKSDPAGNSGARIACGVVGARAPA